MKIIDIKVGFPSNKISTSEILHQFNFEASTDYLNNLGIDYRYLTGPNETSSDLVIGPAQEMMLSNHEIDFLIFSSLTLDYKTPTTASILHKKLGLKNSCGVMDLPYGCAAFPMALSISQSFFLNEKINKILILFGETPSQAVHSKDMDLRLLFGDAGVAVLLEKESKAKQLNFVYGTDSEGFSCLNVLKGGARFPIDSPYIIKNIDEPQLNRNGRIQMDGLGVLRMVLKHIPNAIHECLEVNKIQLEEVDFFLFHHASQLILNALQKKCGIPKEKMLVYLNDGGNTISCSMPIALERALQEKRVKNGDKILMMGFGVGFSWCGCVFTV